MFFGQLHSLIFYISVYISTYLLPLTHVSPRSHKCARPMRTRIPHIPHYSHDSGDVCAHTMRSMGQTRLMRAHSRNMRTTTANIRAHMRGVHNVLITVGYLVARCAKKHNKYYAHRGMRAIHDQLFLTL